MWMESLSTAENHAQKCPTCGGGVQRRPYGEMHAGSFVSDGQRVELRLRPADGFADPIVLDPITVYFDGGLYRLWPQERYWSRSGQRLHRAVWSVAFGPIPKGCHIHHRDNDTSNNHLSNLECVDGSEHLSKEWHRTKADQPEHFTIAARSAAAKWHQSDAGRLWHSRTAKRTKSWTKWTRAERPCQHCGTMVDMVIRKSGNQQKYCSETCKALAYRKRNGIDWRGRRMVPHGG